MEKTPEYKEIEIVQITAAADSNIGALWGVSKDNKVYDFDFKERVWKLLPMITLKP